MSQHDILVLYYSRYGATRDLARLIAEGIETLGERDFVADCGIRLMQGYLFARPMPASELAPWLQARALPGRVGTLATGT